MNSREQFRIELLDALEFVVEDQKKYSTELLDRLKSQKDYSDDVLNVVDVFMKNWFESISDTENKAIRAIRDARSQEVLETLIADLKKSNLMM